MATGAILGVSYSLALKAEALCVQHRTSEDLEAVTEANALAEKFEARHWCANCTGYAVCFQPLWVPTRPKLMLRSTKPSELPGAEVTVVRETC